MKILQLSSLVLLICSVAVSAKTTVYHNIIGYTPVKQKVGINAKQHPYQWQRFISIAIKNSKVGQIKAIGELSYNILKGGVSCSKH